MVKLLWNSGNYVWRVFSLETFVRSLFIKSNHRVLGKPHCGCVHLSLSSGDSSHMPPQVHLRKVILPASFVKIQFYYLQKIHTIQVFSGKSPTLLFPRLRGCGLVVHPLLRRHSWGFPGTTWKGYISLKWRFHSTFFENAQIAHKPETIPAPGPNS